MYCIDQVQYVQYHAVYYSRWLLLQPLTYSLSECLSTRGVYRHGAEREQSDALGGQICLD